MLEFQGPFGGAPKRATDLSQIWTCIRAFKKGRTPPLSYWPQKSEIESFNFGLSAAKGCLSTQVGEISIPGNFPDLLIFCLCRKRSRTCRQRHMHPYDKVHLRSLHRPKEFTNLSKRAENIVTHSKASTGSLEPPNPGGGRRLDK